MLDSSDLRGLKKRPTRKSHEAQQRPPFESIALLLQGGGALGAYQAGVYQALSEANLHPDWVAGVSIGAINSALIAGNPPETRVEALRRFWELLTSGSLWSRARFVDRGRNQLWGDLATQASEIILANSASALSFLTGARHVEHADQLRSLHDAVTGALSFLSEPGSPLVPQGDAARGLANHVSASVAVLAGVPGFFTPRLPAPFLQPAGTREATSWYDTSPLKSMLERFVDFDRINSGAMRFSVGAVNVASGNFVYFDNATHTIRPEHILASGALPPGFPAVEIEGELYWDGGLISNTPLQWVLETEPRRDTLAFQVDLWNARGALPHGMPEVMTRQKEIQYSSRTRACSDRFKHTQKLRSALASLLAKLPEELKQTAELDLLDPIASRKVYNLVQLIYRSQQYEGTSKDYEFSRPSMEEHWRAGYQDTVRTLRHPEVLERPTSLEGVFTFDLAVDGRE